MFVLVSRKKTIRNSIWIITERIISAGIAAIITIFSARYLGAENYGTLNYVISFVTLFLGIMKLGLDTMMVNELIRHRDRQGSILGTSIVLRFISGSMSALCILALISILNSGRQLLMAVAAVQVLSLLTQAVYILDYWFQSKLASKYVSLAKIIATVVFACYSAFLLISKQGLIWFSVSLVLSYVVTAATLLFFYIKNGGQKLEISRGDAQYLLKKSYHFIITDIIITIYIQIDKILVSNIIGNQQLGFYAAALTICTAWAFLPDAIITSLRPSVFLAKKESYDKFLLRLKQLYFIVFWVSIVACVIISALSIPLVRLLFGDQYKSSIPVLALLVWYVPFSQLGSARSVWTVSEEKQKYSKYHLFFGVVINVALNLILIPKIGIMGSAIATIATEVMTCFITPMFYQATRPHTRIVLEAIIHRF